MNPFSRPSSGAYRTTGLLPKALLQIGQPILSEAIATGKLKIAIKNTITGNVTLHPEVTKLCIESLAQMQGNDMADYYHWDLVNGNTAVASAEGAFVYDPSDESAKQYVEKMLERDADVSFFS